MTYLYHYHAMTQLALGTVQHSDGVLTVDNMMDTTAAFIYARDSIARLCNCPTEKITICSLTLLNPH